MYFVE